MNFYEIICLIRLLCLYLHNIKPHIVDWKTHQKIKQFRDNFCREWRAASLGIAFEHGGLQTRENAQSVLYGVLFTSTVRLFFLPRKAMFCVFTPNRFASLGVIHSERRRRYNG